MWWAQRAGDPARSASLFDAIFAAYFQRGEHIGRPEVLAAVAAGCGFDHAQILALLAGEDGDQEVAAIEQASRREGIHAVPTVRIEQLSFSGAQPAASILTMLERATSKHAPKVA